MFAVAIVVCCCQYLGTFALAPVFTEEEFCHWFMPRQGIVDSYVVEVNCRVRVEHSTLTDMALSFLLLLSHSQLFTTICGGSLSLLTWQSSKAAFECDNF